jgi:hypothetical protein
VSGIGIADMQQKLVIAAMVLVSTVAPAAAQESAAPPPPHPPTPLSPPDDPEQEHCLEPDAQRGIAFTWDRSRDPSDVGRPIATYIEIRRSDPATGEWHPWVKAYANPPFTLLVRPRVYDAVFAWRVWAVDRSGHPQPYATPSEWWLFCTEPRGER